MVVAELTLPAEPDLAWRHLREPELIRRWFGWDYDGLDHEIEVIFLQHAAVDDRGRSLSWGDGLADGDRFELTDLGVETGLRVVRGESVPGFDDVAEGWLTFAHQLRFALAHPEAGERRSLHLTGGSPGAAERALALGERWYRSEHQAGVLVDGGLLTVAEKPPASTASMTFSTFGAAPDEARWRGWWG